MNEITRILSEAESGDPSAAEQLLPLVYEELRMLAGAKLAQEKPGQTLQATALVHEAYLRLVGAAMGERSWDNRGHFFAAAAEAMRRILVERARRKAADKHGGGATQIALSQVVRGESGVSLDLLAVDEALEELEEHDPQLASLVKLRFFAGLNHQDAALALGISRRAADRLWSLARVWLFRKLADAES